MNIPIFCLVEVALLRRLNDGGLGVEHVLNDHLLLASLHKVVYRLKLLLQLLTR